MNQTCPTNPVATYVCGHPPLSDSTNYRTSTYDLKPDIQIVQSAESSRASDSKKKKKKKLSEPRKSSRPRKKARN